MAAYKGDSMISYYDKFANKLDVICVLLDHAERNLELTEAKLRALREELGRIDILVHDEWRRRDDDEA